MAKRLLVAAGHLADNCSRGLDAVYQQIRFMRRHGAES